jgi:hypothetical protein
MPSVAAATTEIGFEPPTHVVIHLWGRRSMAA